MRPTLRATRLAGRRLNSSSAPQMNPQVQKAVESASKVYNQGAAHVKRVAGPVGEKIGSAMGGYREPIVYNSKVFAAICRQVYKAEKLAPPTQLSTWANAYSHIWARATNGGWWRNLLKTGGWVGLGIGAVEAYGIFSIGEMIGRRNVVGYKLRD